MKDHVRPLLTEAAIALLAGRLVEARTRYEACLAEAPALATLGLALAAWLRGDFRALGAHAAALAEGEPGGAAGRGMVVALEGLARVHAGELEAGLARLAAGMAEARAADDGSELNAAAAMAEALLHLGRWHEARATIQGVRDKAEAASPLATLVLHRLDLALAVLGEAPGAGAAAEAAADAARAADDPAGLAWALRWWGAWLARRRPDAARAALQEAASQALQGGQHLLAGEALGELAGLTPPPERARQAALARAYAHASGSLLAELGAALRQGGGEAAWARGRVEALLAGLDPSQRAAFLAWPGRAQAVQPAIEVEELEALGATLAAIAAPEDPAEVLRAALAAFVAAAGAERGFLLRLDGFEVVDQVVLGGPPDAYSTSLASRVMWSGEPVVVEDLETDPELARAPSVEAMGLRMALGVPLRLDGELVGVLLADGREAHPGFTPGVLARARAIAAQAAVAWRAADRAERRRAGEAVEGALARAALAALAADGPAAALPAIAAEAAALLDTRRLVVEAADGRAWGVDAGGAAIAAPAAPPDVRAWAAASPDPLVVADGGPAPGARAAYAIAAGPGGLLYLDGPEPGRDPEGAARLLRGLAAIVGTLLAR